MTDPIATLKIATLTLAMLAATFLQSVPTHATDTQISMAGDSVAMSVSC